MSSPSRDQPTQVLPSTAEQPAGTTDVPPPARFWRQTMPARLGRARTSTVVVGVLFLAFFALYLGVRPPAVEYTTVETTSGETFRVPVTARVTSPEPSEPAAPDTEVPEPGAPGDTTAPPATPTTTAPRGTSSEPDEGEETTEPAPSSTRAPAGTRAPATTRAPVTTDAPEDSAEPEDTATPTG